MENHARSKACVSAIINIGAFRTGVVLSNAAHASGAAGTRWGGINGVSVKTLAVTTTFSCI